MACIYQAKDNVSANEEIQQIAWIVYGANSYSWTHFKWSLDYVFFWIDHDLQTSWQTKPADPKAANSTVLSHNEFGYVLSDPYSSRESSGTLRITQDASVPATGNTLVGIGMDGAGTFAATANPNQILAFTPKPPSSHLYYITFGQYALQTGDVLDPSVLNPPGAVQFTPGFTSMTATLDSTNAWAVTPGRPPEEELRAANLFYEAGIGLDLRSGD